MNLTWPESSFFTKRLEDGDTTLSPSASTLNTEVWGFTCGGVVLLSVMAAGPSMMHKYGKRAREVIHLDYTLF